MLLRIRRQRRAEALQIGKSKLLHDHQHLGLVPLHLVEPDLVNLRRRLVQRRHLPDQKRIVSIATRASPTRRDPSSPSAHTAPLMNFANR